MADIRSTNPKLWNGWRQSLLQELYNATRHYLRNRYTSDSRESTLLIEEKRQAALEQLQQEGFQSKAALGLWEQFGNDYHLQHSVETVVWHTRHILRQRSENTTLIQVRRTLSGTSNVVFVYTQHRDDLFTRIVASMEQLNLNIGQARIVSTVDGFDLYTLHILGSEGQILSEPEDLQQIVDTLSENLEREKPRRPMHRKPRILRNFNVPTRINFTQQLERGQTQMEVNTGDMPGLLSRVGEALDGLGVRVHNARINTLGEQAQDIFYITLQNGEMIIEDTQQTLIRETLMQALQV